MAPLNAVQQYKAREILSASPAKLVFHIYDYIIQRCLKKDAPKASKAIALLIDSLDFECGEISSSLFRLYEYSMRMVWEGNYDIVLHIFRELKETWQKALSKAAA
ncbi:MAG TPA: flagellar protein FliS [Candidatus Latescibacteria bacterium]|nr:flagellar protein FliS [Candidatus Latescibacterota bacterium]